jgi:choline kinase
MFTQEYKINIHVFCNQGHQKQNLETLILCALEVRSDYFYEEGNFFSGPRFLSRIMSH